MSTGTLLFLDTEFTNLIGVRELLSLALVSEDGTREFYAERIDVPPADCSEFVREVVLPLFGRVPGAAGTLYDLQWGLRRFLNRLPAPVQIACDHAPDFDLLRTTLGSAWPDHVWPRRLKLEAWQTGPAWAEAEAAYFEGGHPMHHALEDARALRAGYRAWRQASSFNPEKGP